MTYKLKIEKLKMNLVMYNQVHFFMLFFTYAAHSNL